MEYVIGHMISPFKAQAGGEYKVIEQRLFGAILLRFGLPAALGAELTNAIKAADHEAAYHEATRLAGFGVAESRRLFGVPKVALVALDDYFVALRPDEARRRFLARFAELDA